MVYVPGGLHCGPDYMSKYSQEGVGTSTTKEASRFCTQGLVTGEEDSSSNIKGGLQMATKAALSYNDDICAVTFQRIKAEVSNDTELAGWWIPSSTHHMSESFQLISTATRDSETTYMCRMVCPCMGGGS